MEVLAANVGDRVLAMVRGVLDESAIRADVHPESRLVDIGLNSMDMVMLMLKVEAEFDLVIPQHEITPENFYSVSTLERMIVRQIGQGPG
jgi:acyl carrier protein